MKKIIFARPLLIIILIILFYLYLLKTDYKKALNYCILQNPLARGESEGCMEDYLMQKIKKIMRNTENDSEYDKEQCVERIMF